MFQRASAFWAEYCKYFFQWRAKKTHVVENPFQTHTIFVQQIAYFWGGKLYIHSGQWIILVLVKGGLGSMNHLIGSIYRLYTRYLLSSRQLYTPYQPTLYKNNQYTLHGNTWKIFPAKGTGSAIIHEKKGTSSEQNLHDSGQTIIFHQPRFP